MRSCLLYFLFFGLVNVVFGQKAPIVYMSDKLDLKRSESIQDHILSTPNAHFVTAVKLKMFANAEYFIHKYDKEFNLLISSELTSDKKNVYPINIYNLGGNISFLTKEEDKKADLIKYHLTPIDYNCKPSKPKKLATFSFERSKDEPDILFEQSQDSSLSSFVFYVDNNDDEKKMQLFISVVDKNSDEKWSKKVSLKKSQEVTEILSSAVNSAGNVYLLVKEYEGEKAKETKKDKKDKKTKPAYKIKFIKISETDQSEYVMDLKDVFVASTDIKVLANGDIGALGLYSATKKLYVNGVFSLKMNGVTDSIYAVSKRDFTTEELAVLDEEDETQGRKEQEGLDNKFKFLDLSYNLDGSAIVTMEENSMFYRTYSNGRTTNTVVYYQTFDAIVINLDPTGKIEQLVILPKKQQFANTNVFNSSTVMVREDGVNLVYNEQEDNLKKPYGEKKKYIKSLGDCVATNIFIDKKGNPTRTPLFTKKETKAVLLPRYSRKINKDEVFIFATKPGNLFSSGDRRIGIISYK
jgi:hypothetical protein